MPGGSAHRSLEGHREGTGGEDNRQQARFSTGLMEKSQPFCSTHIVKFNARVLPRRNRNFLLKCARGSYMRGIIFGPGGFANSIRAFFRMVRSKEFQAL